MNLTPKKIRTLKFRTGLFLVLFFCFFQSAFSQEFEWVYTAKRPTEITDGNPSPVVKYLVTNSNNDTYAIGSYGGTTDFGDDQEELNLAVHVSGHFLVKLDENKNVLYAKRIGIGNTTSVIPTSIILDENENLLITGFVRGGATELYFDPNPPDPNVPGILDPTYENLSPETFYGFILKLDEDANYLNSVLFEDIHILKAAKDQNHHIIVVGNTIQYDVNYTWETLQRWAYVAKLDSGLNMLWEKTFDNQAIDSRNGFADVQCDSQNNIYVSGFYRDSFIFGNTTLEHAGNDNNFGFTCKLSENGDEDWIVELYYSQNVFPNASHFHAFDTKLRIDAFDNIYFFANYNHQYSYQFSNTTINNLPLEAWENESSVLFKTDANGNHLWNVPLYGSGYQPITGFDVNSLGEAIVFVPLNYCDVLYYKNPDTAIETDNANSLLLKINVAGELTDFKRMEIEKNRAIEIDIDNNILLGGLIENPTDFDPHPFNDYTITPATWTYQNANGEVTDYTIVAYVLKLAECDVAPLFEETYDFCVASYPETPTVGDIEPSALNVRWYGSMTSTTPLTNGFELTGGQTYYYDNIIENCPNYDRLPVTMVFLPAPSPPVIAAEQPCYFEAMHLSDLNINGENLLFYSSVEATEPIESSTIIVSGSTYYVTQTIDCESERVPVSVTDYFGESPVEYTAYFCISEENVAQFANLADYNHVFIPQNVVQTNYVFSFHTSFDDANGNHDPITDFQNYPVSAQSVYVRVFSTQAGCYKIAKLFLQFSTPPIIEDILTRDWANRYNSITVLPEGENYTYSLDGITYQEENYFGNLPSGEYTVYIKNNAGCEGEPETVYLMDYPKFFTPNGDGINDYWRVEFSQFQKILDVEIYDRYGKLLTTFDKDALGWDGKLNKRPLPSSDYWFWIIRISDRRVVYRGHFSLIR